MNDLLRLTLRMQQLEKDWLEKDTDGRDANSQLLVEWVRAQPDIKRQWLAKHLSGNFGGLLSKSALERLKELASSAGP